MEIKRDIMLALQQWKDKEGRKPLIIQGARQIGKTWVMKEFGRTCFEHVAYFNFDQTAELALEFERTKEPQRLLKSLALYCPEPILPGHTLIIFDEIQECNKALNSLKYFCEEAPEYHVLAAGSLLGVSLSRGDSFPVGKVEFLRMYPVSFREFLHQDSPRMYDFLEEKADLSPLPEIVWGEVTASWRRYQVCGGMPAATMEMLQHHGVEAVDRCLQDVLNAYALDFSKHAPGSDIPRIAAIWKSVPSQLSRENRKFVYKLVKPGARAREYEDALLWMEHAGLIYRVFCLTQPGLPLSGYEDVSAFKIYLSDAGLLRKLAQLPAEVFTMESSLFKEFKGAMAENVILQSLLAAGEVMPRYWTSEAKAEVNFILQLGTRVIPVEVKSGVSLQGKSLAVYRNRFAPSLSLRYSMKNLQQEESLLNIPLFLADWTRKFVGLLAED
jgi:predicted AAA+ superfamily ATPase